MNENVIMMCFHKGTLLFRYAFIVMWTLYFSHFCTSFFIGSRRICLCAKVCNLGFIFVHCFQELIMWLINWRLHFLERKNTLSVPKFSPQTAENRTLGLWSFKIFRAYLRPDPSLQCRRIVGGWNLVRARNIVVATIFDFKTVEDWGE